MPPLTTLTEPPAPLSAGTTVGISPGAPDLKAVRAQALRSLEKHRKAIVEKCLKPSLARKPEPAKVNLTFSLAFDTSGSEIGRGISEDRETSRPDVTSCVQQTLPRLSVDPQPAVASLEVGWTLP